MMKELSVFLGIILLSVSLLFSFSLEIQASDDQIGVSTTTTLSSMPSINLSPFKPIKAIEEDTSNLAENCIVHIIMICGEVPYLIIVILYYFIFQKKENNFYYLFFIVASIVYLLFLIVCVLFRTCSIDSATLILGNLIYCFGLIVLNE